MTEPSSAPPENQRVAVIYTGAVYGPDRGPALRQRLSAAELRGLAALALALLAG